MGTANTEQCGMAKTTSDGLIGVHINLISRNNNKLTVCLSPTSLDLFSVVGFDHHFEFDRDHVHVRAPLLRKQALMRELKLPEKSIKVS